MTNNIGTIRPKGWAGDAWVVEQYSQVFDMFVPVDVLFFNPTADYRDMDGYRVRRATVTMEE
ncbi:hypothetical protein HW450_06600 [Corynebacterium hindlerae]|uniref:Uncharacterized protein n=1 Tax=Corynebacterium hindlerae TaxID=699041 RepID=A0A7G5FIB9_9CORY|nr:hypothetical protein [Corynebacterium hindlerae]QMV86360.1 hypothetical protein HW450_06600 [Corynebacterium hindlerae]